MSAQKQIRISAVSIFPATVRARREKGKGMALWKTLYVPLHKGIAEALQIDEGDTLHLAVVKIEKVEKDV